jgi:hypothetical protein
MGCIQSRPRTVGAHWRHTPALAPRRGRSPIVDITTWRDLLLRYIAAVAGILLCRLCSAGLLAMFDLVSPWPWAGNIITGLITGTHAMIPKAQGRVIRQHL